MSNTYILCYGLHLLLKPILIAQPTILFIRDGVMVLALIIPLNGSMVLNFAIVVGVVCTQVGLVLAVDLQLTGFSGLIFISVIGVGLSLALGVLIGLILNRVKGKEMISTIIIGFLATSIY